MEGPLGEQILVRRHSRQADAALFKMREQLLARDVTASPQVIDGLGEFGQVGRIVDDLERLQMQRELLPLVGRPALHLLDDFGVAHAERLPKFPGTAI